jgi:hypothetical protein
VHEEEPEILLHGAKYALPLPLPPDRLVEDRVEDRHECDPHERARDQPQFVLRGVQPGRIRDQVQVGVKPVHRPPQGGDPQHGQDPFRGQQAAAGVADEEEYKGRERAEEHARAAGAEWQLALAQLEGAQVDAVADGVPDRIRLAKQAVRRARQPQAGDERGQEDDRSPEGFCAADLFDRLRDSAGHAHIIPIMGQGTGERLEGIHNLPDNGTRGAAAGKKTLGMGCGRVIISPPSSVAQSAEQPAVNRWVVGSSPTRGAWVPGKVHATGMRLFV